MAQKPETKKYGKLKTKIKWLRRNDPP